MDFVEIKYRQRERKSKGNYPTIIHINGELMGERVAEHLRVKLGELIGDNIFIVIGLSDSPKLDKDSIDALRGIRKKLEQKNGRLVLYGLQTLLEDSGFKKLLKDFEIYEGMRGARDSFFKN